MNEKSPMQQRLELKTELDAAMMAGELTIERLRSIPPTATSIEHHTTLMKQLKAEGRMTVNSSMVEAVAFLATKNALEDLLYETNR